MRFARLAVLSALLLAGPGCSDDVPPTPKGAFSVSFQDTGTECAVKSHNMTVGSVTDTSKQTLLSDGQENAEVKCKVTGSGPFAVSGSILQAGKFLDVTVGSLASGTKLEGPATGSVGYAGGVETSNTYSSKADTPCNFYFTTGQQGVAAGRVWMAFDCPKIVSGQSTCELVTSYVIFENCDKGDAEE